MRFSGTITRGPLLLMLLLLWTTALCHAAEPQTAELRGNRWVEVAPAPTTAPSTAPDSTTRPVTDAELVRIEQVLAQRRHAEARQRLSAWLARNPHGPLTDHGLFLMAEALYQQGNRIRAFYYLENLLDEYPESPLFVPALRKQYQIADRFLRGYRQRFFGMPLIDYEDEAVEMLYRVRQRAPGSQLAEQALLRTADYYFADAQYDLAADAYGWYAREHPRSPHTPRAKLRQAFSNYAQFRGLRFDATPLVDARAQLAEVIGTYPELAEEERLAPVVQRIDRTFAEKLFETADFYRRTGEPRAAVYTYRYLIAAYPGTPEADKARRALEKAPKSALESTPPGAPEPEPGATPVSAVER